MRLKCINDLQNWWGKKEVGNAWRGMTERERKSAGAGAVVRVKRTSAYKMKMHNLDLWTRKIEMNKNVNYVKCLVIEDGAHQLT